ncbi:hypothetical protein IE81DRAFT_325029, partial [Ceraceosorus guamensis]
MEGMTDGLVSSRCSQSPSPSPPGIHKYFLLQFVTRDSSAHSPAKMSAATPARSGQDQVSRDPLAPAFDPTQLKVPQLRSLLLEHGISLPGTPRKQVLLDAFDEHVRPQLDRLRAERANVRADGRGIHPLGASSQASRIASSSRSRRKVERQTSESEESGERAGEEEEEEEADRRGEGHRDAVDDADSSFSDRNFFQQRTPPVHSVQHEESHTKPSHRAGRQSAPSSSSVTSSAQRLIPRARASIAGTLSGTPKLPAFLQSISDSKTKDALRETHEASQSAAPRSGTSSRKVDGSKRSSGRKKPGQDGALEAIMSGAVMVMFIAITAYYLWYVQRSHAVGFCDAGGQTNSVMLKEQADATVYIVVDGQRRPIDTRLVPAPMRPTCAPCPDHARCSTGALRGCGLSDYRPSPPLLSYMPFSRWWLPLSFQSTACQPDSKKAKVAVELGRAAESLLRERRGAVLCGYRPPHRATLQASPASLPQGIDKSQIRFALPEPEVQSAAEKKLRTPLPDYADLDWRGSAWSQAVKPLEHNKKLVRIGGVAGGLSDVLDTTNALLLATSAQVDLGCQVRLLGHSLWRAIRLWVAAAVALVSAFFWARWKVRSARRERDRVHELVNVALERLQDQEYAHAVDPVLTPDPFVPTAQLRDHVLQTEYSAKSRQRLWSKVSKIVEANSNCRVRQARSRGEMQRVWEWIGVSAGASLSRRQSMSFRNLSDVGNDSSTSFLGTPGSAIRGLLGQGRRSDGNYVETPSPLAARSRSASRSGLENLERHNIPANDASFNQSQAEVSIDQGAAEPSSSVV